MKKTNRILYVLLLCLVLVFAASCGSQKDGVKDTGDSAAEGNETGNVASSDSEGEGSNTDTEAIRVPISEDGVCDVMLAGAVPNDESDQSEFFHPDAVKYIINGGTYCVDADTLRRLTTVPCEGNGSVKWVDFDTSINNRSNEYPFTGVVPVDKLTDPIFMATALPSEANTYMTTRTNASNLYQADDKYTNVVTIGAIYKNADVDIPDDAEITVCLGRTYLLIRPKGYSWFSAVDIPHPTAPTSIYPLPWRLEWDRVDADGNTIPEEDRNPVKAAKLESDRITYYDDHVEIKLYGSDLKGSRFEDERVEGSVLHFWGDKYYFEDFSGGDIMGLFAGYEVWIKEEEYENAVVAAVGADWRDADGNIAQAFSGMNFALTTEKKLAFGHTVGTLVYDIIMDSDRVQALLK